VVYAKLLSGEYFYLCGLNVGGADEHFERCLSAHALEINGLRQHVSEGIEVERIKLIWRREMRHWFNEPKAG
jgi:hypothetical protein